ncbi:polyamine aminopropyltransferase [Longimicrobium sp.]|uniref:polyamine aminopropyltransferase n=1 Tax=Longimicrobium sp. TaxID=2029185 RepID=UPI002B63EE7F|nr:polyamine aminopropyltransferase [Longimicrobium sp.]HSU13577.1 polyamine aminopropyltransferase [Longimicrobium sp.]
MDAGPRGGGGRGVQVALFLTVLLIAACGLVYELVAGALSSYLLGDSVTQFSTVIGTYLFAMGVGSHLSRYVTRGLAWRFVTVELMVAVVGGFSATALFLAFAWTDAFRLVLYALVIVIGALVGLEIPLLMRILRNRYDFKDVVANVLTFDYLGALGASLLFPILLVPRLGMVRSALAFGVVNALVALWSTHLFRDSLPRRRTLQALCAAALVVLGTGVWAAEKITRSAEADIYADPVVFSRDSRYQRIVLTAFHDDLRLFLNGHLQFSSRDEYRYHEALVHPGLAALLGARRVLVLGGGDGLAVREILRYPGVSVTLVDLDPEMTHIFRTNRTLVGLNRGSLNSPRVRVINADAFVWLGSNREMFDFVVVDFPDPSNYAVGKLYTTAFYRALQTHLSRDGLVVVQSTSPMFARTAFWSIERTLHASGLRTWPYHLYVPSFGEWGFVMAGRGDYTLPTALPSGLRFLTLSSLAPLFQFPADLQPVPAEANRLDDQALVRYYGDEWKQIER